MRRARLWPVEMLKSTSVLRRWANRMISTSAGAGARARARARARASDRVIGTTTGAGAGDGGGDRGAQSPWMMIRPREGRNKSTMFRFWCLSEDIKHNFYDNKWRSREGLSLIDLEDMLYVYLVGASQGWLAYTHNCHMYLIDPTTFHCINLPPLHGALRDVRVLQLAPDRPEREGMLFMIFGGGHALAFCWPRRSTHWTLFGGNFDFHIYDSNASEVYQGLVYSTTHRRLFCITSRLRLEAWDVDGDVGDLSPSPKLLLSCSLCDLPREFLPRILQMKRFKYLVCEEESGDLFLVVRYVLNKIRTDLHFSCYDNTSGFEVYKIDLELMTLTHMKDSLQGLTIFVGNCHPVAIKHVAGVKPDSIYFAYDERICSHNIVSVFDYRKRLISPLRPAPFTDTPVWFIPTPYIRCSRSI